MYTLVQLDSLVRIRNWGHTRDIQNSKRGIVLVPIAKACSSGEFSWTPIQHVVYYTANFVGISLMGNALYKTAVEYPKPNAG